MNETVKKIEPKLNRELRAKCAKFLSGHRPPNARDWLSRLAASEWAEMPLDQYGEGPLIQKLEAELAALLGKEAAVFVHKGVVAQQSALKVWTERAGCLNVALHPKSHIDADERKAYERLQGLHGIQIGRANSPFSLHDLQNIHELLGAIVVELPLRRAGYKLPEWDELVKISAWAHSQNVPLHFDGARLWESAPYYGKTLAEIAALADSVYLSFYKGLGGMDGCVLAGPQSFIKEARIWNDRMGASLFTAFPFIISAMEGLQHYLPKMEGYYNRAGELAAALAEVPNVVVAPNPPQTNAFQIYLPNDYRALRKAANAIAEKDRIWLFGMLEETAVPNLTMGEITVGEATAEWSNQEIVAIITKLLEISRSLGDS